MQNDDNSKRHFSLSLAEYYTVSLPKGWPVVVQKAMLHIISLSHFAMIHARGWAANSTNKRVRLQEQLEAAKSRIAQLKEEIRIKDQRMERIPAHRRPRYLPTERMQILELRAACSWSKAQTSRQFLVSENTIADWSKRLDDVDDSLLQFGEPVNKFPDFVRYVVQRLKTLNPTIGKKRIADLLCRAGLHLAISTIGRMINEPPNEPDDLTLQTEKLFEESVVEESDSVKPRIVTAKYPHHVWHIDLTLVPTACGFWASWLPNALEQCWPFCWWLAAIVDHFSRRVIGFAIFDKQPTSKDIQNFLNRANRKERRKPKYIISDKGPQFWSKDYKRWAESRTIKLRFGAIGQHGSIAVIERFFKTLKEEFLSSILIPLRLEYFQAEIRWTIEYYNSHRPHTFLNGRTPNEACYPSIPANIAPRFEPRKRWPAESKCASPQSPLIDEPWKKFKLHISYYEGRKHLPIIELKAVA